MSRFKFAVCGLALLLMFVASTEADEIPLNAGNWSIQIDPASLKIAASDAILSDAQHDLGPVEQLKQTAASISWRFSKNATQVTCDLSPDELSIKFVSDAPTTLTFPLISPQTSIDALILPMFQGLYVPLNEPQWRSFLTSRGELNTTGDLSMPFIGLHRNDKTITYILADQFNNTLTFNEENGSVATRIAHEVTPIDQVRTYRVIIRRGDASPVEPARQFRRWLIEQKQFVPLAKKIEQTPNAARLLGAIQAYLWGDGVSTEMLDQLRAAGIDRACLSLGDLNFADGKPDVAALANKLDYVLNPYDSYDSIHSPKEADTWITAQFDESLYETGPIVRRDGTKRPGFQKKGFHLSPLAARPYVERRVNAMMSGAPFTSWFMDCDGFGDVYDDYSPAHQATQAQDAQARLDRLSWLTTSHHLVVGTEGGSTYAAPVIHFAHGMMTPVIGWGDPDLKDRKSKYFLGAYWPPTGPNIFFKSVPCKPEYAAIYFDPRYRLPLYQTVFNDSVIATHHWTAGSFKFADQIQTNELLELLYNVPPLYHLNLAEWKKRREQIKSHYDFFSPMHRELATVAMTDFKWLTPDRLVQQTTFGESAVVIVNFSDAPFQHDQTTIAPRSAVWTNSKTGESRSYSPAK
jgi:hypothetical protein